jgi:RNA-binding protein 39
LIVLTFCTVSFCFLQNKNRRTGWANLNTSVPNLEEVSSSEFPDDAVARIAKVNEVFKRLNTTGLAPLPSFTLIPGMGLNDKNNLIQSLNEPPTAAASNSAIASAAEEALNAAFAMTSSVNPVPKLDENTAEAATTITEKPLPTIETPALPPSNVTSNDPKKVSGELSNIILVRNMFDKDEETDDGWEEDIKLDFEEESSKHGKILSVKVISKEVGGKIYASFETVEGAKACAENLAGRWFDKRQLQVEFVTEKAFDSL